MAIKLTRREAEERYIASRMKEVEEGVRRFASKIGNHALVTMLTDLDGKYEEEQFHQTEYEIISG